MITITLTPELAEVVSQRAEEAGTSPEIIALDALQDRFLAPHVKMSLPAGATMADAFADYIGSISTRNTSPGGSSLSENTGRRFGHLMSEKRHQGRL